MKRLTNENQKKNDSRYHFGSTLGSILGLILGSILGHLEGPKTAILYERCAKFRKPVLVSEREAREKSRDTEKDTETTSDKRRQQERLTDAVNWNAG